MYALYKKLKDANGYKYMFQKQVSLFGCNSGYIPYFLQKQLRSGETEPFKWELDLKTAFEEEGEADSVLIINLKPNNKGRNLSLYELMHVWGYSSSGWTPIMIHIHGLFIDEDPRSFNDEDFVRKEREIEGPIFSMMYLNGTISQGQISGKWTTPGPSPTNSVLLWPETLDYFSSMAKQITGSKA